MNPVSVLNAYDGTPRAAIEWWETLEDQWKMAYNEAYFNKGPVLLPPTYEEIDDILKSVALRFVGPDGPYPNLSFKLTNLSGLKQLKYLKILVANYHKIESLASIKDLHLLESLFAHDNCIQSIEEISSLVNLQEIFIQNNLIQNLLPLRKLIKLQRVYILDNCIKSLQGVTKNHSRLLKEFYCLPNEHLEQSEIIRVEQKLGIRCLRV